MDNIIAAPQFVSLPQDPPTVAPPRPQAVPPMGISITQPIRPASTRHSGVLFFLLAMFILLLVGPFLVGRFVYETKYNELKAGYDVATGTLQHVKSRLNDLELASRLVAKRVEPSVVSIVRPSGRFAGHDFEGQGSGVIVDAAGYIVTNFHVVEGAQTVQVHLSDRRTAEATVVGADAMTDIAVLKIDLGNLIAAEWGDSDKLEVGDLVWASAARMGWNAASRSASLAPSRAPAAASAAVSAAATTAAPTRNTCKPTPP